MSQSANELERVGLGQVLVCLSHLEMPVGDWRDAISAYSASRYALERLLKQWVTIGRDTGLRRGCIFSLRGSCISKRVLNTPSHHVFDAGDWYSAIHLQTPWEKTRRTVNCQQPHWCNQDWLQIPLRGLVATRLPLPTLLSSSPAILICLLKARVL